MPEFKIINNISEIKLNNNWIDSLNFKSKNRIVDDKGKPVSSDYAGHQYQLIAKKERSLSFLEQLNRVILAIDPSLNFKTIKKNFIKNHESIRFGVLINSSISCAQLVPDWVNSILELMMQTSITGQSLKKLIRDNKQNLNPNIINHIMTEASLAHQTSLKNNLNMLAEELWDIGFDLNSLVNEIQDIHFWLKLVSVAQQRGGIQPHIFISKYDIKNEKVLIEIAKLAAQQNGSGASEFIQNYGIQDEQTLVDIAKLVAQQDGREASKFIQNYGIQDEQALIDIAKLAAQQSGRRASEFIQNYGIQDEQALVDIAKLAAQQDGSGTSEFIQNYGIQDKQALVDIAKLAAQQDGRGASKFIQNYGIQDKQALVDIAKLAAQQDGRGASKFIQNYGIQDKQALVDIAKLAAQQDGSGTSEFIQNYGIQDKQALVDIAKLAAQQDGWGTSKFIQNYDIQDEQDLVDIAKLAAQQDGWGISEFIQNYGIQDEQTLIEIAKLAAQQDGWGTSEFIQNYGIQDEQDLVDIAKLAAQQNGRGASKYIQNYGIQNETVVKEIFLECMRYHPACSRRILTTHFTEEKKGLPAIFLPIEEDIAKMQDSLKANNTRNWMTYTLLLIEQKQVTLTGSLEEQKIFQKIATYPDPRMRNELSYIVCGVLQNYRQQYINLSTVEHLTLPCLFLCQLPASPLLTEAIKKERGFREGPLLKRLLDTMYQLSKGLNQQEMLSVLTKALVNRTKKQIKIDLFTIQGIIECGGLPLLKQEVKDLNAIYQQVFQQIIPISHLEDFNSKYFKTFGSQRDPSSLLTYAGKIQDPQVMQALILYVESTLEEKFETVRYEKSPHLQLIFNGRPKLEETWKAGSSQSLQKPIDYEAFFKTKILPRLSNHSFITAYLLADDKQQVKQDLIGKIRSEPKNLQYRLQKEIIDFMQKPSYGLLKQIENRLLTINSELVPDIQDLLKTLQIKDNQIVDTDHFWDLFMCGTDIAGSCQKVDGDSSLNKCLMAYLLDGKHRLLAIKDPSGKIVGRSIIRLLWDEKQQEPILMQERIYPKKLSSEQKEALDNFAKSRAQALGLRLFQEGSLPVCLTSKGGRAPWEYVDSLEGMKKDGCYIILQAKPIYTQGNRIIKII